MTASILSNGRIHGAFGLAGGQPGQVGVNRVVRSDGSIETLGHIGEAEMLPGDVFEIWLCWLGRAGTGQRLLSGSPTHSQSEAVSALAIVPKAGVHYESFSTTAVPHRMPRRQSAQTNASYHGKAAPLYEKKRPVSAGLSRSTT